MYIHAMHTYVGMYVHVYIHRHPTSFLGVDGTGRPGAQLPWPGTSGPEKVEAHELWATIVYYNIM